MLVAAVLTPERTKEAKFQAIGFSAKAINYYPVFGRREGNLIQCFLSYGQMISLRWLGRG